MKLLISTIALFVATLAAAQTPANCNEYTTDGSVNPYGSGYTDPNAACGANVPGIVTSSPAVWTGTSCTGYLTSTLTNGPANCIVLSYGAVNTNDYGTITTDTGGNLTLDVVNAGVNGNEIGPYNCGSGSYGNVMVTVCSDIPFNSVTLTNTGCSSGWVINCASQTTCTTSGCTVPCLITNMTANTGTCDPITGNYSTTGVVEFTDPPATGQLVIEDCNGNQDVYNAPFTSPVNYTITGQTADGANCDITAFFTDDVACTQTISYVAPVCVCNIDNFTANIGLCDQNTDTYSIDGTVEFTSPPAGGTLIIEVNNGTSTYDTIINSPFTSPQTWSISGIPSDGSGSTVQAFFSNNNGCSSLINFTAPTSCACNADIGTYTASITGQSTNNYVLCYGDEININTNNDWVGPGEQFNPPGPVYDPGVSWLAYSCPPTVAVTPDPNNNVPDDPCFLGVVSDDNLYDINDQYWMNTYPAGTFTDNTVYFVPLTFYSQSNGTYSYVNGTIPCYEMGTPFAVQYLPDFTYTYTEDCLAGTADITLNGALPAVDGSNFTVSNLSPATASFANTTAPDGGTIQITGLQGGDNWSFDVTDGNGCSYTVTGGPFPPLEDPGFNYAQTSWCTTEAAMTPTITGVGGGTFTATPAGLTINAVTGQITPATSTPGTYDVTYTTPGACFDDSTITVNISATPSVDPVADQTVCNGDNFTAINFTGSAGSNFDWTNDNTNIGLAASGSGNIAAFAGTATTTQESGTITVTPSAGSCVGTPETFILTVDPTEDATFNYPAPGAWCTSEAVQSPTITGTAGGTFTATPAGLTLNATTGDITPGSSTPGTYDVTYTTPGPCVASSTVQVTINEVPVVDPVTDETVCVGDNFTAVNFTSATAGTTFDWTNDNVNIGLVSAGTGNIAAFAGQTNGGTVTGNITVTPSTANCTGTPITFALTVNDLDDASFSYTPGLTYCQTAADPVTNLTGLAGGTFSYTTVSGGPTLNMNTTTGDIVLATSDIGSYDITYNTATAGGSVCPNSQTLTLVITPAPVADFTLGVYCQNDTDPLPTYINGGSGGTFTSTAGLAIDANSGLVDLGASTPGTYTVTNEINVAGCPTATAQDDITINELPTATISGTASICSGDPLPDVTIDITAGTADWDITYNLDGIPTNVTASATPYVISGAGVGTYDLIAITDANGCSSNLTGQVVIDEYPTPVVDALPDQAVCEGDDLLVNTFSSTPPGSTFAWTNTTGTDIGFGLSGSGDIGTFTSTNGTGTAIPVTVEVIPTSADGCVGPPETFTITVNPLPIVSFVGTPLTGCEPLQVEFTNTSTPTGSNCFWDFGNGISNGCGTVYSTYMAGTYDVSLTVTTAAGCASSDTYVNYVEVMPQPEAIFSFTPQEIDVTEPIVQFNNSSIDASSYEWDFGDGSPISTVESPPHLYPSEANEYTVQLIAYDPNGWCPDTATNVIVVDDIILFYVPNVMTPDGDEFNETFQPVFTSGFDPFDYHLTIFNRWGEIIFESYNAEKGWNGHYGDGGLVQDGVYVWQIEFKESMSDRRHTHRGHVTVLK